MNNPGPSTVSPGRCQRQLEDYIEDLEKNILAWYERNARKQYRLWFCCFWVSIVAGFAASLTAALVKQDQQSVGGWRAVLIILPSLGSFAGLLLNQFHFRELEDLRERGRIDAQDIIDWARGQLAAANGEQACLTIYEDLRNKIKELELSQHREFTKITHPQKSLRSTRTGNE